MGIPPDSSYCSRFKAGVHLNGIFAPLNTGLVQISRFLVFQKSFSFFYPFFFLNLFKFHSDSRVLPP